MTRTQIVWGIMAATMATALFGWATGEPAAAEPPADRVVVMYFHRTERCPTCRSMGDYAKEAFQSRFAEAAKEGKAAFYFIDYEQPKNAALAKGYRVDGPALIVAKIQGNKVKEFKDLNDIWLKVRDKPAFVKYVQEEIAAYCD